MIPDPLSSNPQMISDNFVCPCVSSSAAQPTFTVPASPMLYLPAVLPRSYSDDFIQLRSRTDIFRFYDVIEEIGRGTFSVVYQVEDKITGCLYACKEIAVNSSSSAEEYDALVNEVDILSTIHHDNIVKLYRVFVCPDSVFLIMELLPGGELFDHMIHCHQHGLLEVDAAALFRSLVRGVAYLHSLKIIHGDLKLENIVFGSSGDLLSDAKITDFGLSVRLDGASDSVPCRPAGTAAYVAPEVLLCAAHTTKSDMWSLGVMLFALLTGCLPFSGNHEGEIFANIASANYVSLDHYPLMSSEAKDLVRGLLQLSTERRLSAEQVLAHPWLKRSILPLSPTILGLPSSTNAEPLNRFRRAVRAVVTANRLTRSVK